MKRAAVAIAGLITVLGVPMTAQANDWKPTSAPLMTRWGKQVTPENVHPEYPRPQLERKDWQSLNGLWDLAIVDSITSGVDAQAPSEFGEKILVPFPVESALSGVGKHSHHVWYRRNFEVPGGWKGRRIILNFEAVDWEAHVYVNGKKVGEHKGGYDPFSFDVTDALKANGQQEVVVGVYDPADQGAQARGKQVEKPRGIFYTPSTGIWQSVWMEPVAEGGIASIDVTPDPKKNVLKLDVKQQGDSRAEIAWTILDDKKELAKGTASGTSIEIKLPEGLQKWSPETPKLYNVRLSVSRDGKQVDEVVTYFGLRTIEIRTVDKFRRIFLNDKEIFQVGPLDQGFWPDGLHTPPTDEALRWDIEQSKALGFNMIRKHIKVEPARWYYWCDKLGVLVWQDMVSGHVNRDDASRNQYEHELQRLIETRRFSPSIIMWVVFNEGWGQYDKEGTARLTEWTKKFDPTRIVNSASGWTDYGTGDVIDMHMYPGPGAPKPEKERASVLGEYGGLGLPIQGHMWSAENWGYQGTASKENLTERYIQLMRRVYMHKEEHGLCAAVYTQITDVETETNGLITYDREVMKIDVDKVKQANLGKAGPVTVKKVVPTAEDGEITWRYTTERPGQKWFAPEFDDSGWKEGLGGFGRHELAKAARTDWNTTGIWLRRDFDLPSTASLEQLYLLVFHDDDVEVYFNGERALRERFATSSYVESPIAPNARATLKPGKNKLAVHCKQGEGWQYIDVGLVAIEERKP